MKQNLLFVLLLMVASVGSAQNFEVEPSPAFLDEVNQDLTDLSLELINHATLSHSTSGTVELGWQRTIVSAPSEWLFPVCDRNQCYFPEVSAAPFPVVLDADSTSLLDVHVQPQGVAGCATVELTVTPFSNLDNVLLTATYEFKINNAGECTSSVSNIVISKVRAFPNPTSDIFKIAELENIPEADEVAVYNIVGKQVKSFSAAQSQFNVGDLPDGMYMVSLISKSTGILKTVRMSKSAMRP